MAEGFAYQGEPSPHADGTPRGSRSAHLPSASFVICLQNHDQIGNRAMGERVITLAQPHALRAATALLLLTPQIPLLFMGEEWGETRPFLYFTDHNAELGGLVRDGRRREFARFQAFTNPATRDEIPDPNALETFEASRPTPANNDWTELYKTCLQIRATQIIPRLAGCRSAGAAALSKTAIRAAWRMNDGAVLTLAANFGAAPVGCPDADDRPLFSTSMDDHTPGMLPGFTTLAWMQNP